MVMYTNPEFMDAEIRYRRERLARDWQARSAGGPATGAFLARARSSVAAVTHLRAVPRRHRPA